MTREKKRKQKRAVENRYCFRTDYDSMTREKKRKQKQPSRTVIRTINQAEIQ